jgi:hypothetical protein
MNKYLKYEHFHWFRYTKSGEEKQIRDKIMPQKLVVFSNIL